ncbi:MAG: endonuclease III [Sedimentisphaerales bacterium]|nr:endonuclease III [Sedimentisphaerales bacterium]
MRILARKTGKKAAAQGSRTPKGYRPSAAELADAPRRARRILAVLKKTHPDATIALRFRDPLELLVATILSAQCTDVRVNLVTRQLFAKYRRAADYAAVDVRELEADIKSTGFFRHKAKNIQSACRDIDRKFAGRVPDTMEELTTLAGVGRKTANVILGNAYGVPGVVTDTHVIRLSRLMALSAHADPVKLEHDLMELIPPKDWTQFSHLMIFHGRRICQARQPACPDCPVRPHCGYGRQAGT